MPHRIVPDTVHLIRVKSTGSLGQQNDAEGLLAHLPDHAWPRLGYDRATKPWTEDTASEYALPMPGQG